MSLPYILFYSNGCKHSSDVMNTLKSHSISKSVHYFCIDGMIELPNYIQYTPTMRIIKDNKQYVIIGSEIYTWLDSITIPQRPPSRREEHNQEEPPIQEEDHQQEIKEELEQLSYQENSIINDDFDNVFNNFEGDPAAELDAMFANKPMSTRDISGNNTDTDFQSRMDEMEKERANIKIPPRR